METLSVSEQAELDQIEAQLAECKSASLKAGKALKRLKETRLYRGTHATLEGYCLDKYQWDRLQVYRMIREWEASETLLQNCNIEVATASQATALMEVPPEKRGEVWEEAVATAPVGRNGKPKNTARHIRETAAAVIGSDFVAQNHSGFLAGLSEAEPETSNTIWQARETITNCLDACLSGKPAWFHLQIADCLEELARTIREGA